MWSVERAEIRLNCHILWKSRFRISFFACNSKTMPNIVLVGAKTTLNSLQISHLIRLFGANNVVALKLASYWLVKWFQVVSVPGEKAKLFLTCFFMIFEIRISTLLLPTWLHNINCKNSKLSFFTFLPKSPQNKLLFELDLSIQK